MENIDKIKCVLIDFENNDKTLDEAAKEILLLFSVSGRSEQLHLCPVCNENAGKSYLLSKLPTICQNCDHAWNRA